MIELFVVCVALIFWAYFGYPLSIYLMAKMSPGRHVAIDGHRPSISVIIAVAGGADKIYDKLRNTFATTYPLDKMEVIVVMDGVESETAHEVERFGKDFPKYAPKLHITDVIKGGKEHAQLKGVNTARNEICIFTDLATTFTPDTYVNLVEHFGDKNIGAVDGMSHVVSDSHSNEGIYLKYENKIREWESRISGLVTLGGCLFAARKWVLQDTSTIHGKEYHGFVNNLQSDFRTALVMQTWGLTSVLEANAIANFKDGDENKEFGRKHRTIVRGINNFFHNLHLLNPFYYGMFSYAFFCHKLLKWMVPFFMIGAFVASFVLAYGSVFWSTILLMQSVVYGMAIGKPSSNKYIKILQFLVMSNLAILKAWYSYLVKGERFVSWEPTKR